MSNSLARRALPLALAGLSVLLASCASSASGPSTTSSSAPTTSTTTTLPSAIPIAQTSPNGPLSFLGPVWRVGVITPELGSIMLPPEPTALGASLPTTRIAYRRFGSGPNLLLVMGEHGTMSMWDPQLLSELAQHFSVTIFDLPGVGYSATPPSPITLATYADDTAGLVVALGLELPAVTIVGWGLGGTVVLDAVVRHPQLASGLVLVDALAPGSLEVPPSPAIERALASPLSTTTALSYLVFPANAAASRTEWLARIDELEPDDEIAAAVTTEASVASSIRSDGNFAHALSKLKVPVRVMTGDADRVVPVANAAHLAAAIPHAHLLVLHDAGYASLVSDEARFVAALVAFAS